MDEWMGRWVGGTCHWMDGHVDGLVVGGWLTQRMLYCEFVCRWYSVRACQRTVCREVILSPSVTRVWGVAREKHTISAFRMHFECWDIESQRFRYGSLSYVRTVVRFLQKQDGYNGQSVKLWAASQCWETYSTFQSMPVDINLSDWLFSGGSCLALCMRSTLWDHLHGYVNRTTPSCAVLQRGEDDTSTVQRCA